MPSSLADTGAHSYAVSRNGNHRLQASLVREFYSSCCGQYKLVIPWALVLSIALWEVVPHIRILTWFVSVTSFQIVSRALCAGFSKACVDDDSSIYWLWGLTATVTIGSLVAGSGGALLYPSGSLPHQFIVAFFVSCLGGVAAIICAAHSPASIISIFAAVLPLSATLFYEGSEFSITMGAVLLLIALALVVATVHIHGVLLESLKLRFEKDDLIESAFLQKEKVEALNSELEVEVLERKLVAESLARSEERYRAFVNSQTELVCRLVPEYSISFANEAFGRYFGIKPEDFLDCNFFDFIGADDHEMARDLLRSINCDSPPVKYQHRVSVPGGGTRWLEWTFQAMGLAGEIREYQGVGRDISDRKQMELALQESHDELEQRIRERTSELQEMNAKLQLEVADRLRAEKSLCASEQRFRTIFEKARDCIFVKDVALRYTHVNPAMQSLLEIDESGITGLTDEDLYGPDQTARLRSEDVRVLGGQVIEAEHTLKLKGRELTFNSVKVPMMNSSGNIEGLCGIARDITERSRTQVKQSAGDPKFRSNSMREALNKLRMAAGSDSLVLLLGESGSGKDFLARHLHRLSHRSGGPFFAINCAALAPELAESELFGHEPGSFTGARSRKRGMLELAEGGTLLLNEIGELSLTLQAKLLTFLDTKSFTRVGGETNIEVNARLIAATNRDLRKEVEDGRFRHDLYHRLNVFAICVPPLRERLEDFPLLVDTILDDLGAKLGHGELPRLDVRCLPILSRYHWPGNVRELRNVLERAIILSEHGKIKPEAIKLFDGQNMARLDDGWYYIVNFPTASQDLDEISREVKSELIKEALRRASGVRKDAAKLLGVSVDSFKYHSKCLGI